MRDTNEEQLIGHLSGHGGPTMGARLRCIPCAESETERGIETAGTVVSMFLPSPNRCARCGRFLAPVEDLLEVETGGTRR